MTLLPTKLFLPSARPKLVARPRLLERLNSGSNGPLTLISAPAGYGKSTLVSAWAAASKNPVAWLSLDEGDNDPVLFWSYIQAALQKQDRRLGESVQAAFLSPPARALEQLITRLIDDVLTLRLNLNLVLEDYHVIENADVHTSVNYFLDHLPTQVHLIITTRSDPPLHLALRRSRRQVSEIRAKDLRFTPVEVANFLNQMMGLGLTREDLAALARRTEGWIAGLQMAALSLKDEGDRHGFVTAFTGNERHISDYLIEEVLQRQPTDIQLFLLETSILDRFCASLCEAVTGREDSQEVLNTLERENLFLIPLDQERRWYRFHDLFSSLLQRQLRSQAPRTLVDLHQRASEWNEKAGFTIEAVRHALEAEDSDRASALLERNSRTMSVRGEHVGFLNWVKMLGPAAYKRPWLCIAQAGALMITGQLEDAAPWLDRVREALTGKSSYASVGDHSVMNRDIFGYLDAYQAYMACVHNDPDAAVQLCLSAIQDLSKTDRTMQGWVRVYLGNARLIGGDPAKAEAAWKEAARMAKNTGSLETAVTALESIAYLAMLNGKLRHAAEICQEGIQIARFSEEQSLPIAAPAYARLAAIQYEWNEIEAALHNAENALELGRALARPNYLIQSFLILARLRLLQQDLQSASTLLHEAEQIAGQFSLPLTADSLLAEFQLRLYIARGDLGSARELAGKRRLEIESRFNHMRESEYLLFVRILLAEGKAQAALEALEWCLDHFKAFGWQGGVIELLILKAKALEKIGHTQEASTGLEQALAIAEPEGYLRSFIDEGEAVEGLLQQVLTGLRDRPALASYASELLSVFEQSTRKPDHEEGIVEALTEREAEVMKYIAHGLSNPEIAGRLYLSPNTLKAHTQNIFAKLNVHNRLQAVNKARKLKLIE